MSTEPFHKESPRKLGHRFSLTSSIIVLLAMSVFWLVTNYNTENILRQQADSLGETLAGQTAILVTELVLSNDLISMNVLLNQLTRDAAVSQAAVLSVDDQVIAISGSSVSAAGGAEGNQVFRSYVAPIALQGSLAGYVRINLDESYIEQGVTRNFNFLLLALLLLVVVAVSITYALSQHYIGDPLRMLESCLYDMRQGTIELSPYGERNDEVGAVIRQYNELAQELVRGAGGRPVLAAEADEPFLDDEDEARNMAVARTTASVLYLCLSNYRQLLRSDAPHTVGQLNACYSAAREVAELYNGNVEICAEDDIMISFGARQLDREHAFHACCGAMLFLAIMSRLNADWKARGQAGLECKAGLHTGELLTGVVTPVSPSKFTIAGDTIDTARRICNEGLDGRLVISEQVYQAAEAEARFDCEAYSEFFDTTLDQLVATWVVESPIPSLKALLDSQAAHLASGT